MTEPNQWAIPMGEQVTALSRKESHPRWDGERILPYGESVSMTSGKPLHGQDFVHAIYENVQR